MAKLIGPLHSTEARGAVGGLIYNTWRGISYAKSFASPAQPRTERQLAIRAITTQVVRAWASLDDAKRNTWTAYSENHPEIDWTGVPKRITGANWYLRCNVRLLDMGKSAIDTAPTTPAPDAPTSFACTGGANQISCAWTSITGTNATVDLWLCGPHTNGKMGKIQQAKHNVYAPGETSPKIISDLTPGTYTVFARVIDETTGLASTWVSDVAEVTEAP